MKPFLNIFKNERIVLALLVLANAILKIYPASVIELGNDEVYYWTYALYPDWSHFDHPPIVGFIIQIFTFNLTLVSELFVRLGPIVLSSASIVLLYYLVKQLYGARAGFIAVGLMTASVYFNVISGLMIHPDTPQVFFVVAAYYFILPSITSLEVNAKNRLWFLIGSSLVGLAFLSKYHSLFVWFGIGLYVLLHNRKWLTNWSLYAGGALTLVLTIPVLYWNLMNNFVSFTFHGERVGLLETPLNPISFAQFNLGQILYQNPINFIIFVGSLVWLVRRRKTEVGPTELFLIYQSLPLIVIFSALSLFRPTLPHWTGPCFIGLTIISSKWLATVWERKPKRVSWALLAANLLVVATIYLGAVQIKYGLVRLKPEASSIEMVGRGDFTLDMFGWQQAKEKFEQFLAQKELNPSDVLLISDKWFPAAHIDFYIAYPLGIDLIALGSLGNIHKYQWINQHRKPNLSKKTYYITVSQYFCSPNFLNEHFEQISRSDTIPLLRNGQVAKYIFLYEMGGYKGTLTQFPPTE